ncbi:rhodanese-like domain-containing protein [Pelodictyon phaeoclathratiforme]|uniref:Rhodanese domain protein n=1 Tax=Pelodictyon phaeoclathratiforme (strain DSM 5477 / BU-1) TaxID=324925 RepID=B4SB47_PELPB|nr:rhodanese-like domain-containing protein [Pelodictyon phaeoclathratiforme]ACF42468.1 rhodanese domain protein [Pelodictyon phaeoclathratiforme BU-1]
MLVDVREAYEVARKSFDVPEIMLIPFRDFEKRFQEIPVKRQVIIACNSGSRSAVATRILMTHGYRKVVNMQYGIMRWAKEGLPVKGRPKQTFGARLLQMFRGKS